MSTTLRLHKVDVHSKQSTTSKTQPQNSESPHTTTLTARSMDNLYLKPSPIIPAVELERRAQNVTTPAMLDLEYPGIYRNNVNSIDISLPSSSPCSLPCPKTKRVNYARDNNWPDVKTAAVDKREPLSEKARVRRQASTLSTGSDKVMILGDVATNETMIFTSNHSNNKQHFSNNYNYKDNSDTAAFTNNTAQIASVKSKTQNGLTAPTNAAIAIATLSPTSCLSLDKSASTTVVTHLQKNTQNKQNKKFRFSPFSKITHTAPKNETATTTFTTNSPERCAQFCTPFCSCSSSFSNEDQLNRRKDFVTMYDDCTTSSRYLTSTINTCDKNCLMSHDLHQHHHNHHQQYHTFNTTATSTAHNWNNFHHQQEHVCMCFYICYLCML